MDFVRSYFFPNETLGSWTYLSSLLGGFAVAPTQKWWKKCSTAQSFIGKEVTSYKICILVVISPWNLERQRLLKWLDKYVHDEYTASTPQLYHEHLNANAEQTDHWTWNKSRKISLKIGFLSKEWSLKTKIGEFFPENQTPI